MGLDFIDYLLEELEELDNSLKIILNEEKIIENNILSKHGFLIRRYSVKWDQLNSPRLSELHGHFKDVLVKEKNLFFRFKQKRTALKELEKDYNLFFDKKLRIVQIINEYMGNFFYVSKIVKVKLDELLNLLNQGVKLHPLSCGGKVNNIICSLERNITQCLKFVDFLKQLLNKIKKAEETAYEPSPKTYGRVMSKKEKRTTTTKRELTGSPKRKGGDLIGAFYSPPATKKKIEKMTRDQRKDFFGQIGVVGGTEVIFFETTLKPKVGPIKQANGLDEYKFPKGTPIEILDAA
tara:strand:+ start:581 stop:1459 length:879 start_codon:yes stop_codon:yes gene_type:complete